MTFDGVEYVVGVTSRGSTGANGMAEPCGQGRSIASRPDSNAAFIAAFIGTDGGDYPPPGSDDGRPGGGPSDGEEAVPKGTVVTGCIERGTIKVGDEIEIVGLMGEGDKPRKVSVTGTQAFHKDVAEARAGMNVGLLLRGVNRDEVERGQVICAPGSIKPHTEASAEVYILTGEEGGRKKPIHKGYMPQFFFGTTNVTGEITLPEGIDIILPGEHANLNISLGKPVGMEPGVRFAIREGGKTIGAGVITEVR